MLLSNVHGYPRVMQLIKGWFAGMAPDNTENKKNPETLEQFGTLLSARQSRLIWGVPLLFL